MTRQGRTILGALFALLALTACVDSTPLPTASDRPSASSTPTESPTPSSTPSPATPSPAAPSPVVPTPSPPPVDDPAPQRVEGVTATTGGGSGEVLLRWTPNPEGDVVRYIVLRASTPGGELTRIGTVTPEEAAQFEVVPFVDSQATVGYYRVRAVDAAGQEGAKSREVCGASPGYRC